MASGVKCDARNCDEFGELPADPMGGHAPVGEWVVIKTSRGTYHAHNARHAGEVAEQAAALAKAADEQSEAHAQELQRQSEELRKPPENDGDK